MRQQNDISKCIKYTLKNGYILRLTLIRVNNHRQPGGCCLPKAPPRTLEQNEVAGPSLYTKLMSTSLTSWHGDVGLQFNVTAAFEPEIPRILWNVTFFICTELDCEKQ